MILRSSRKGIILYMVLGVLLIVAVLANVIVMVITSHTRFTEHQVRRIKAYYAAMGGIVYAREMLILKVPDWAVPPVTSPKITKKICPNGDIGGCNVIGSGLQYVVNVEIYNPQHTLPPPAIYQLGCAYITADVDYTSP